MVGAPLPLGLPLLDGSSSQPWGCGPPAAASSFRPSRWPHAAAGGAAAGRALGPDDAAPWGRPGPPGCRWDPASATLLPVTFISQSTSFLCPDFLSQPRRAAWEAVSEGVRPPARAGPGGRPLMEARSASVRWGRSVRRLREFQWAEPLLDLRVAGKGATPLGRKSPPSSPRSRASGPFPTDVSLQ